MRRRFRTGRVCLDLAHTGGEGEYAKWEILDGPEAASRFLGIILGTVPPSVTATEFSELRDLRAAITRASRSLAAGGEVVLAATEAINRAAKPAPLVLELGKNLTVRMAPGTGTACASTIARDAIDLFGSPLAQRIRVCAAEDCQLLYVDASRPGTRRWCSMEWCGDRSKKRAAGRPLGEVHRG
jgi:predicted RNA-binding Zn ribbon-like protein